MSEIVKLPPTLPGDRFKRPLIGTVPMPHEPGHAFYIRLRRTEPWMRRYYRNHSVGERAQWWYKPAPMFELLKTNQDFLTNQLTSSCWNSGGTEDCSFFWLSESFFGHQSVCYICAYLTQKINKCIHAFLKLCTSVAQPNAPPTALLDWKDGADMSNKSNQTGFSAFVRNHVHLPWEEK